MRIQIASDLHLEIVHQSFPGYNPIAPSDADVLVLFVPIFTVLASIVPSSFFQYEPPTISPLMRSLRVAGALSFVIWVLLVMVNVRFPTTKVRADVSTAATLP